MPPPSKAGTDRGREVDNYVPSIQAVSVIFSWLNCSMAYILLLSSFQRTMRTYTHPYDQPNLTPPEALSTT